MGILKGLFFRNFLKRVGSGLVDSLPVVSTLKKNIESNDNIGGVGKIDYLRLIVALSFSTCLLMLTAAYLKGIIPLEDLKEIISLIVKPLFKLFI